MRATSRPSFENRRPQVIEVEMKVNEPRSRSSPKFQKRSPSGLRWNPTYHGGYVNGREHWKLQTSKLQIRQKNHKLSDEKGQYQSLMLSRVAAERLKPDMRSEGQIFVTFADRTPARKSGK